MRREDLLSLIHRELLNAPLQFEKVAGVGSERMPEYWVVCQLMNAVSLAGMCAVPEVAADWQFSEFDFGGMEIPSGAIPELARARIDLFICDPPCASDKPHVRVIMELKGSRSTWDSFGKDIARLRRLSGLLEDGDIAVILAYVTAPLAAAEQKQDLQSFLKATGLLPGDINVFSNLRAGTDPATRMAYVYTCII